MIADIHNLQLPFLCQLSIRAGAWQTELWWRPLEKVPQPGQFSNVRGRQDLDHQRRLGFGVDLVKAMRGRGLGQEFLNALVQRTVEQGLLRRHCAPSTPTLPRARVTQRRATLGQK
jgi:GNAT superfamily N-acetyltransferase